MAYDENLAERIRRLLHGEPDIVEKRMFGGLAFLVGGHMGLAASREGGLLVHVDAEDTDALLEERHARPFVMRGREMRGWLRVEPEGCESDGDLTRWVRTGIDYGRSLPPKA